MKNITLVALCLWSLNGFAQHTSGTITYEQAINIDLKNMKLPEGMELPEGIELTMPNEAKQQKLLYFNADASLYENKQAEGDEEQEFKQNNVTIRVSSHESDDKVYTDLRTKKHIQQKDLMDRTFLITDETGMSGWKMTGRQKKILDMPCMEAVLIKEQDTVNAWYTTAIPVSTGPEIFGGLPGMVMEVNAGPLLLTATAFVPGEADSEKIKAPAKGKKISAKEFEKLQKENEEEMMKEFGGGGNVIMKTRIIR